jgi:hypothetical protein
VNLDVGPARLGAIDQLGCVLFPANFLAPEEESKHRVRSCRLCV